jgi:hypothetical protein
VVPYSKSGALLAYFKARRSRCILKKGKVNNGFALFYQQAISCGEPETGSPATDSLSGH